MAETTWDPDPYWKPSPQITKALHITLNAKQELDGAVWPERQPCTSFEQIACGGKCE